MKKIISMVLAIIMIAAMASVIVIPTAAAEPTTNTYASVYTAADPDFSWYGTEFDDYGERIPFDPTKTEYTLTSVEQFQAFQYLVGYEFNQFRGITIKLGCDIVWNTGVITVGENGEALYNGEPAVANENIFVYEPIGDRDSCGYGNANTPHASATNLQGQFYGSFDGQGHTVSGLYYEEPSEAYAGFFSIFCGREIKNLSIINSYFSGHSRSGSFAGFVVGAVSSGENQDVIANKFENLYSNAAVILTGATENNSRSGGIFGMCRPMPKDTYSDDDNPAQNGWKVQLNQCWFDGTIWALHTTRYNGGLVGMAAMDDNAGNRLDGSAEDNKAHLIEYNNCLVTGVINNCPEPASVEKTASIRIGLIQGGIYRGEVIMNNCVVNLRDTNINENTSVTTVDGMGFSTVNKFLPPMKDVTNAETGETTQEKRTGKGIVGYYESLPCNVTYSNVFFAPIGYFTENLTTAYVAAAQGTTDMQKITGEVVADASLAMAVAALGTNDKFSFANVDGKVVVAINGLDTTVDPVDPTVVIPKPSQSQEEDTGTIPDITAKPSDDKPTNTTTGASTTTKAPVTTGAKDDEKSCGGFTAIGAVLALIAVTGAAIVIKKK